MPLLNPDKGHAFMSRIKMFNKIKNVISLFVIHKDGLSNMVRPSLMTSFRMCPNTSSSIKSWWLIPVLMALTACGGDSVSDSKNGITEKQEDSIESNENDEPITTIEDPQMPVEEVEPDDLQKSGIALWSENCQACHGSLEKTNKRGRSVALIAGALETVPLMSTIKLSSNEMLAISEALKITVANSTTCVKGSEIRSIDCFYHEIINNGVATVADAIPLLPDDMKKELFLMTETKSRHKADEQHPRIVMYGDNAELIVSMSSHPEDPMYEVFELIEPLSDGGYKFRLIDMTTNPPSLSQNDTGCQSCHSEKVRPIWNGYRNWPGLKETTQQERSNYAAALPQRMGLLDEQARWSGEVWNFQHARLYIRNLMKIAKTSDRYDRKMRFSIAADACKADYNGNYLKDLGIDASDINAGVRWFERTERDEANYRYFTGSNTPELAMVEVAIIDLLYLDKDEYLQSLLTPFIEFMQSYYPLSQSYYDQHNGLLPFAVPQGSNGGSKYGYGGRYYGLHLFGHYSDFWGLYPRDDIPNEAMKKNNKYHNDFCAYVKQQAGIQ